MPDFDRMDWDTGKVREPAATPASDTSFEKLDFSTTAPDVDTIQSNSKSEFFSS